MGIIRFFKKAFNDMKKSAKEQREEANNRKTRAEERIKALKK